MWAMGRASHTEREDVKTYLFPEEEGDVLVESRPTCTKSWHRLPVVCALLGLASLVVLVLAWPRAGGLPFKADVHASTEFTFLANNCASQGMDCRSSHCCLNGGKDGFQCYGRDADWAQCDSSCVPGIHEEDFAYDQDGQPAKPKWSCEQLGDRSEPACFGFETEFECPVRRCEWKDQKCTDPCWSFASDTCASQDQCTWNGTFCQDACWTFTSKDSCQSPPHGKRCGWKDAKCNQACWTYSSKDTCGKGTKCIWHSTCQDDPCSAPGEDCRETKCCSALRSGGGMTCFENNEYYATCTKACDGEDWSCKKLGNRTKTQTHCAWAGEDCASWGLCCNQGFICAVKDKYFTGCVQNFELTSFKKLKVPYPPGWPANPKFIGGGQLEYAAQLAAPGKGMGTTLYCFMAYLPGSYEERLMEIAKASGAGIFACDAYDLFHTWKSQVASWDTKATTLTNIDVFLDVWNHVEKAGKLWKYDWTVKSDPDCLIVPQRLRWHLAAANAPRKQPVYVKNNNLNASIGNNGFLGAVEVFSREALELYFDWWPQCKKSLGLTGGEDGFMKRCMDAMGVGYVVDGGMFKPDDDPALCTDVTYAAYHPLKSQENLQCCIDVVNGGTHKFEWGKCKDLDSKWVRKVWPMCTDGQCREPKWYGG